MPSLRERILPRMAQLYGIPLGQLRVREAFFVQYAGASSAASEGGNGAQAGLELHRDGTLLSCNVLLNPPSQFRGGGTYFADEDRTVCEGQGDFVVHCGQVLHGAASVVEGVRIILVVFVDEICD